MDFLAKYVKGKDVLNMGCVESSAGEFLQEEISRIARSVTGVDINREGLKRAARRGFHVMYGDVQDARMELGRRFDVIVAGEIIEHMENTGIFLENVRRHMKDDGVLIISTPNARQITYQLNRVLGRVREEKEVENAFHVSVHSIHTLTQLLGSHGMEVRESAYMQSYLQTRKKALIRMITRFFPDFSEGLIVAAVKKRRG